MDRIRTETPQEAGTRLLHSAGYRSEGGRVTMPRVKRVIKKAFVQHEDEEHGHEHKPIQLKAGGAVKGEKPKSRPDRRSRGEHHRDMGGPMPGAMPMQTVAPSPTMGVAKNGGKIKERKRGGSIDGDMNGTVHVDRRYEAEGIDQPHGPEKRRANGGDLGEMASMSRPHGGASKGHGKGGGPKVVNVIVGKGDDGDQKAQMAHQQGMQQGVQVGARMAAQKMAAGAGGPPRPPMAPPPGGGMPPGGPMPPPGGGGMAGGPPMMGAPRPPGAMPPQMARRGGHVRDEYGRFVGGAV